MTGAILRADWPAPPGVIAFTTLRHGAGASQPPFDSFNLGLRCGDEAIAVARNRAELQERFGLPSAPNWLHQVHGTTVVRPVGAPHGRDAVIAKNNRAQGALQQDDEPEADAAITSEPDTVLAILSADCLPAVFAAVDGSEAGAAHAGWRGLAAGVLETAVAAMRTPSSRLQAWLGPAAGPAAYEVGVEVRDAFLSRDTRAASAFVATRSGHWHVDLYALARMRLGDAGVRQVYGGGLCTISDPARFFSHRRDARTGRMATLIWRTTSL